MTDSARSAGAVAALLVLTSFLTACASQQLKLEMERQVVLHPPEIKSLTTEPTGDVDTRDTERDIKVVMTGDPGLKAVGEASLGAERQAFAMNETQPGTYEGSFRVPRDREGMVNVVGRLRHEPTGAQQEIREGGIVKLIRREEMARKVDETRVPCPKALADEIDAQLEKVRVHFGFNKWDLGDQEKAALQSIAEILKKSADCRLSIEGHADEVGSIDYNQNLSVERAEAVRSYLEQAIGIPASSMVTRGFGKSKPLEQVGTQSRVNRRVELHVAGAS